jgi:hypothetical protein
MVSVNVNSHQCKSKSIALEYVKSVVETIQISMIKSKCTECIIQVAVLSFAAITYKLAFSWLHFCASYGEDRRMHIIIHNCKKYFLLHFFIRFGQTLPFASQLLHQEYLLRLWFLHMRSASSRES